MTTNNEPAENLLFQFKKAIKGKENSISIGDSTKIMEKHLKEGPPKSSLGHTETKHTDHHTDCYVSTPVANNKCLK